MSSKQPGCSQRARDLLELTCHMGLVLPPLPQTVKAGTRFSDPGGIQG